LKSILALAGLGPRRPAVARATLLAEGADVLLTRLGGLC